MENGEKTSEQEVIDDAEEHEPTLYENMNVNIRGWHNENEDEARYFANAVLGAARALSRYVDLSHLKSIVVGMNYNEALASVDRGAEVPPAAPTVNEYGQGGAMAMHVMHEDEPWSVVVIWTPLVRRLIDQDHPEHNRAFHTFFHELVHVDDLRRLTRTYPGGWKAAKARDARDFNLQLVVNPCQSEYSAQRRSAWLAP